MSNPERRLIRAPTGTPRSRAHHSSRVQQSIGHEVIRRNLQRRRQKNASDMTDKGVGENFVWFTNYHFPPPPPPPVPSPVPPTTSMPSIRKNPFRKLRSAELLGEKELTLRFISAVNDNNLAPGLKMAYCGQRPDSVKCDDDKQKSDAAFYRDAVVPSDGGQHWADQLIACEFKVEKSGGAIQDPFEDVYRSVDGVTSDPHDHRKENRGQIISYAELLFTMQQRTAVFMLLVLSRKCRFFRWDRSGFVVTRKFDYYRHWRFFVDVLWRISQSSDKRLGLDPTAHRLLPGDPDYELMTKAGESLATDVDHQERLLGDDEVPQGSFVFKYVREAFAESIDKGLWPRYRVEVPDGERTRSFLIGKPRFRAKGLAGRGTRGYVALECGTGRFVWLKDAWRAHYLLVDREGDILERLKGAKVTRIPTIVCHGDIEDQVTYTPQRWEEKNPHPKSSPNDSNPTIPTSSRSGPSSSSSQKRKRADEDEAEHVPPPKGLNKPAFREDCPLRLHKHYRLVVEEVALPVQEFQFGRQLVTVVKDCVIAHYQAYDKLKLLHRDVSGGNVLIFPRIIKTQDGRHKMVFTGLLADWEMAKSIDIVDPRQPERTGTWQYMSVALLSKQDKAVEVCDELESFFYVLLYYAARYLRSKCGDITIANYLDEFFDQYGWDEGCYVCGNKKQNTIMTGTLHVVDTATLDFGSNMDLVLETLLSWFAARHEVWMYERELEAQGPGQSQVLPAPSIPVSTDADLVSPIPEWDDADLPPPVEVDGLFTRKKLKEPSVAVRKIASYASSHGAMVSSLKAAELRQGWPTDDKVGDRIPSTWLPDRRFDHDSRNVPAPGTSNKKQKLETGSLPLFPLSVERQGPARTPSPPPLAEPSTQL